MLEESLYTYLTGLAIVGDRVYPTRLAEGATLPAISFERVSARRRYVHDSAGTSVMVDARMQFDCWARSALGAIQVARGVVSALSGFAGSMAGLQIGRAFVEMEVDLYERETGFYRRVVDVVLTHEADG